MGQRPERCAVGQTWLSLHALRDTARPVKPLSIRPFTSLVDDGRATADSERSLSGSSLRCRCGVMIEWGIISVSVVVLDCDCVFQFVRSIADRFGGAVDQFLN